MPNAFSYRLLPVILLSQSALAFIVINDQEFAARGGDMANIDRSISSVFSQLRSASDVHPFLAVGLLSDQQFGCTATWLGDSPDQQFVYLLTAAHCLPANASQRTPYNGSFTDRSGTVVASGNGFASVHPGFRTPPRHGPITPFDLAIVQLPRQAPILDAQRRPISPPWLYDEDQEVGQTVDWVGYGEWGSNSAGVQARWQPRMQDRRAWIRTRITGSGLNGDLLKTATLLHPDGVGARSAPGDSGSAWWQKQQGFWNIVGVTFGTTRGLTGETTAGPRISQHIEWIRSIYPQAAMYSQQITVKQGKAVAVPDRWHNPQRGSVAYVVPSPGRGPTSLDVQQHPSDFTVPLLDQKSRRQYQVKLHATRCDNQAMNSLTPCEEVDKAQLRVSFLREDNPELPTGRYSGEFHLEARGTADAAYTQIMRFYADIDVN